jgi:hypothetical protein
MTIAGACGRFTAKIDNAIHICKTRNGRGHGMSLGLRIDWPTLDFAEQGLIIKENK